MKLSGSTHSTCSSRDSISGTEKLVKNDGTQDVDAERSVVQDQPGLHNSSSPLGTSETDPAPKQEPYPGQ